MRSKKKRNYSHDNYFLSDDKDNNRIWRVVNKIILLTIFVTGSFLVVSINSLSIKGFILQELKNKTDDLAKERARIELAIMELESYKNINVKAQALKMVKSDNVDYIMVGAGGVAKK